MDTPGPGSYELISDFKGSQRGVSRQKSRENVHSELTTINKELK